MTAARHTVLVGSYAHAVQAGIRAVHVDLDEPAVAETVTLSGIENPSFLAIAPDRSHVYAVSETANGHVEAFSLDLDGDGPGLVPIGRVGSGGGHPCHIGVDPHGRWLAVSNYGSGTVGLVGLRDDGSLGELLDVVRITGSGPVVGRQNGPHTHSATPTPDGQHVIVADLGADRLSVYAVEAGSLRHRSDAPVAAGAGPRHTTIRAADGVVVVANELACTLSSYRFDDAGGVLDHVATVSTVADDAPETIVAEVALSPDGTVAYVSNRGDDSIAVFDLGADGELLLRRRFSCGGTWPRHFAVLPGGTHLLVANERGGELVLLDASDGAPVARAGMSSPTCVVVV